MESKLRREIEEAARKAAAVMLTVVITVIPFYWSIDQMLNALEREETTNTGALDTDPEPIPEPDADTAPNLDTEAELDVELTPIEPAAETSAEAEAELTAIEPTPKNLGRFKLTAYCACPKCCGEWADGITYTGTKATQGRTIAVDPDVIPLGSVVIINGREYVAEDIGGAIDGNRVVDIFFNSHAEALEFGVQYADVSLY